MSSVLPQHLSCYGKEPFKDDWRKAREKLVSACCFVACRGAAGETLLWDNTLLGDYHMGGSAARTWPWPVYCLQEIVLAPIN